MDHLHKAGRLLSAMMDSVDLRPPPVPVATNSTRARRVSDTDCTASTLDRTLDQLTINNKDGSRESPHSAAAESSSTEQAESSAPTPLEQHQCTSEECAVTTMFETTELLELVLNFLDTENVLSLRRTSKRWDDTIRSSPTLRLHQFVHPRWSQHAAKFQLLDLKIPGLSIDPGDDLEMGKWIHVTMTDVTARHICPNSAFGRRVRSRSIFEGMRGGLGRRVRRDSDDSWPAPAPKPVQDDGLLKHETLQVMQPPILGMQAYIIEPPSSAGPSEQSEDHPEPVASAKIHCDSGITLGFLAETTHSLLVDRRLSSGADTRTVLFKSIVSFTAPSGAPKRRGNARSVTLLH